jgi:hypothetical protein
MDILEVSERKMCLCVYIVAELSWLMVLAGNLSFSPTFTSMNKLVIAKLQRIIQLNISFTSQSSLDFSSINYILKRASQC